MTWSLGSEQARSAADAEPGDLLVATEGGALTDAITCTASGCHVHLVAVGPTIARTEGHIAFAPNPLRPRLERGASS
jgi:hypothetical protein